MSTPTPPDPLDSLLDRWREAPPPGDSVRPAVWERIAEAEARPKIGWLQRIVLEFSRPAFAITFAAACVLLGLLLLEVRHSRLQQERNTQLAKSYLRLIDPLFTGDSVRAETSAKGLGTQLAWMQESLKLTPQQFARIRELHEQSSPQLQALAVQVAQMRSEFAAFERARQTEGQVDFLEFARFVEHQRAVDRECLESTQRLVLAASEVMDAHQRERYLAIIDPDHRVNLKGSLN